jgi:hypothetical protein
MVMQSASIDDAESNADLFMAFPPFGRLPAQFRFGGAKRPPLTHCRFGFRVPEFPHDLS